MTDASDLVPTGLAPSEELMFEGAECRSSDVIRGCLIYGVDDNSEQPRFPMAIIVGACRAARHLVNSAQRRP